MHLVFDIFQGIGIAAAVGIRPFLPALAVGALGAGDVQIDFAHCDFSFLQKAPFLLAMVVLAVLLALAERRLSREQLERGPVALLVAGLAVAVGALLFAGSLCRGGYAIWPGIVGGVICAGVGILATRPLVGRVRARLDAESVGALPLFTEAAALLAAVLSVLLPPVGIVVLASLLWLLFAGRGRSDEKYAGLRILR
jgi:uncharacterized membrane protein YgdD (TMEM256/DUF423 family)